MKNILVLSLLTLTSLSCFAQTDSALDSYLAGHRFTLRMSADSTISLNNIDVSEMLTARMQGKRLFVYGQGYSHMLRLNNSMYTALLTFFTGHGLKYVFDESARSWIVDQDVFNRDTEIAASNFYNDRPAFYQRYFERVRRLFRQTSYRHYALDFERPHSFYKTLNLLAARLDEPHRNQFLLLAPYLTDTSYLSNSPKRFIRFYKEQQARFYQDSVLYHVALGTAYDEFRYLLGDPQPSTYTDNRNAMMAAHLLEQIRPMADGEVYYMSCGMAHSRPGKKDGTSKSLVWLLNESDELKRKIVVMNLYCDSCHVDGGGGNWQLGFMKGDVLESIRKAAQDDIVLFDLSALDGTYEYIREDYGDMLVFARNQQ